MSASKKTSPADYAPEIDGIEFGDVYAAIREGVGEKEILDALRIAASLHVKATWWLGDLLAYGEKVWDDYTQASAATGLKPGSLRNIASVSRRVPPAVREPGLVWRHHREVAALKSESDQREYLALALANGMTSDELARAVKSSRSESEHSSDREAFTDPIGEASICPHCQGTGVLEVAS